MYKNNKQKSLIPACYIKSAETDFIKRHIQITDILKHETLKMSSEALSGVIGFYDQSLFIFF